MPKADPASYPNVTRDRYEWKHRGKRKAVLYGVLVWCPSCQSLKPLSKVGLRLTQDGVIRNENNCSDCRKA